MYKIGFPKKKRDEQPPFFYFSCTYSRIDGRYTIRIETNTSIVISNISGWINGGTHHGLASGRAASGGGHD
jgi:hypothetical protein